MSQTKLQTSWLHEMLAGLAVASGVGYLATAYSVSRWLTRCSRGAPAATPSDHGLAWEPLECVTADGLRLAGWLVEPPRPRATAVLFHGLRHNRAQTLDRCTFLVPDGYRCVAFDHRAHGESGGRRSSFGYHEARDVAAVLALVRQRWPGQPCAALGISMGAAALCYAGREVHGLAGVVLESVYHDMASAFRTRIGCGYPPWFQRFAPGVVWVTERRLRLRLSQLSPAEHIGTLGPVPTLLLTGAEDPHAPPEDAERLFGRIQGPKELYVVPGAGHLDVADAGGLEYRRRVLAFLGSRLGR